jgi:hypothetical protein
MCSSLKDFDLQARGVANLVKEWKAAHAAVRAVWKLEDVIAAWVRLSTDAEELLAYFKAHGEFPNSAATFGYFVEILAETIHCGNDLENLASMFEAEDYAIKGINDLRRMIEVLQKVVDEDRFPTLAAFASGALDDWD